MKTAMLKVCPCINHAAILGLSKTFPVWVQSRFMMAASGCMHTASIDYRPCRSCGVQSRASTLERLHASKEEAIMILL